MHFQGMSVQVAGNGFKIKSVDSETNTDYQA